MLRICVEQLSHRAVFEHSTDGAGQQRRDRQHGQTVPTLLFRNRHGVGKHDFAGSAVLQTFDGGTRQHAMCGDDSHRLGTGILKHAACTGNGSGGIDEIVDEHAVLTFDIAHDSVGDRLVRTGDVTRLVDECERTTAKTLRPLLRNTNAARIRRDDGNIVKLVGETVAM